MWYRTGTISIAADSPTVTGSGTAWVQNIRVGDGLQGPDGRLYEVTNVASDTALSIRPNYQGPAVSGESYWIIPVQGYTKRLADRAGVLLNEYGGIPDRIDGNEGRIAQNETRITENDTRIANAIQAMLTKSGNLSGLENAAKAQLNLGVIQSLQGEVFNSDNCTIIENVNGIAFRFPNPKIQIAWSLGYVSNPVAASGGVFKGGSTWINWAAPFNDATYAASASSYTDIYWGYANGLESHRVRVCLWSSISHPLERPLLGRSRLGGIRTATSKTLPHRRLTLSYP